MFDLTVRQAQILDGETWDVTYHETNQDALDGTSAIPDPTMYTNTSNPQIIYVRVTNPTSTCFEIVELELIVNPLPDDTAVIEDYIWCEVNNDGLYIFDLTTKIDEILNGQDPAGFTVSFYENATDAAVPTNAIVDPDMYQNTSNPQTIYVGITNNDTQCYIGGVLSFIIEVREGATANPPAGPYIICDNLDENDGIASFDLQDPAIAGQILGTQTTPPYELTYYETLENATENTNALPNPYTNIINPQIIYARVTNTDTGCFDITEVILKVDLLPIVDLEESYRLCVDENGNPIMEEEGEPSPPLIDTGLNPALYTFVWDVDGVVIASATGPSITPIVGGVYTVTITNIATGCITIASTTVTVSGPPLTFDAIVTTNAFAQSHIIEATATGLGSYVFQLDDGPFQTSGTFTNVMPGTHTVTIKDANGCGSVTLEVSVVDYPLFFTPNQDGYHDTWNIIGIANADPTAKIYIFDRFGKLLKQISPLGAGWDGTYNGNPLPSSDYWFRVEYKEQNTPKEFRGHFTLKR